MKHYVAFGRLNVYLPVALKQSNEKALTKLHSNINRVLNNQPIEYVTAVMAITLGKAIDYWHKKQPLRKQRKAA